MTWFRLGGCSRCLGDLAYDDGDWICMQCGTYFYTGLYRREYDTAGRPVEGAWPAEAEGSRNPGGASPAPAKGLPANARQTLS